MTYETKAKLVKMAVKQGKSSDELATEIFNEAFKKAVGDE